MVLTGRKSVSFSFYFCNFHAFCIPSRNHVYHEIAYRTWVWHLTSPCSSELKVVVFGGYSHSQQTSPFFCCYKRIVSSGYLLRKLKGNQWIFSTKYLFFRPILMAGRSGRNNNYVRGKKVLLGKRQFRVSEGILCAMAGMCYLLEASSPFPPTERVNSALWPHPNWSVMSAGKISSKSGCRV